MVGVFKNSGLKKVFVNDLLAYSSLSLSCIIHVISLIIFPFIFVFLIISAIRGIILSPLPFCFSNISDYLLFILLMKPFFSSRISLLAHLLFLRCLPPFIRTKRRFVGFSR